MTFHSNDFASEYIFVFWKPTDIEEIQPVKGIFRKTISAGRSKPFSYQIGDIVQVVYGDGNYEDFEVLSIRQLQALSPNSTRSTFIDLDTGARLNATTLFDQVYRGEYHSTLQTCLAQDGLDNWGRYFVLAPPLY